MDGICFTAGRAEEELFVVVSAKYQELQYDRWRWTGSDCSGPNGPQVAGAMRVREWVIRRPFFLFSPQTPKVISNQYRSNPNQLSEDYNRHLEIVVILLVRPRICMCSVHIVHICFLPSEGHGRTLGTGGAVFVGDPCVHEGRHGCFNRDMDKKQFLGQWGLCWILCVDGWSVSCNSGRTDGAGIHIDQ